MVIIKEANYMHEKKILKQKNTIVYITNVNEKQVLTPLHIKHTLYFSLILIRHSNKRLLMLD